MKNAVFIDKDGTIVEDAGFVHRKEDFRLIPNAIGGLRLLNDFQLFIITNQSGIGRGVYAFKDFLKFNNHLVGELKKYNVNIQKTYLCPHNPEENCECRKPKTKLIKDAEKEFNIDLKSSFVIGDMKRDIEMGRNAGCKTILVLTGKGMKEQGEAKPDFVAKDLLDAAKWILKKDK